MKTKIVITDDHILVRDGIAEIINKFTDCEVEGVAANGKELIELIAKGANPDLIVLDVDMPVMDGYETAAWLQKNHPEIKILILTMYDNETILMQLLQYDVRGFVPKNMSSKELAAAITEVAQEGYFFSRVCGHKAPLFTRGTNGALLKKPVSKKEMELLQWLTKDLSSKEIAAQMNISVRTVESQKDALCVKFDVKSRTGLAIFAIRNGIVRG